MRQTAAIAATTVHAAQPWTTNSAAPVARPWARIRNAAGDQPGLRTASSADAWGFFFSPPSHNHDLP